MLAAPPFDRLRPILESQLLVEFTIVTSSQTVLDLGCGNGYMAMRLAYSCPQLRHVIGLDIHAQSVSKAKAFHQQICDEGAATAPVDWVCADAAQSSLAPNSVDVIVCNPPFFTERDFRPSPKPSRRLARRDDALAPEQIIQFADQVLQPDGCINLVYPANRREPTIAAANHYGFTAVKERIVETVRKRDGGIVFMSLCRSTPD